MSDDYNKMLLERARPLFNETTFKKVLDRLRSRLGDRIAIDQEELARQALKLLSKGDAPSASQVGALELALAMTRPVPLARGSTFEDLDDESAKVFQDWPAFQQSVRPYAYSVVRIDRRGAFRGPYGAIGTGFLVSDELLVTSRHVLDDLTYGTRVLEKGQAVVRFGGDSSLRNAEGHVEVLNVVAVHRSLDLALFKIARVELSKGRQPLSFADEAAAEGAPVVAVGYPYDDGRNDLLVAALFNRRFKVKRAAPGIVMGLGPDRFYHDCSTLGGNSGSPLLSMQTAEVVGIHSEDRFTYHNKAVDLDALKEFVLRELVGPPKAVGGSTRGMIPREAVADDIAKAVPTDTVRLTNLWITAYERKKRRPIGAHEALTLRRKYNLHLQIGRRRVEALVAEAFPDEKLKEVFKTEDRVTLDVMLFAPDGDFKFEKRQASIVLPKSGNSDELSVLIVPLRAGRRRIRACIYFQNTMLQSIVLDTIVVKPAKAAARGDDAIATSAVIDYVALTDLSEQSNLPSPVVNLFTNEAPDGTHWIGIFSSGNTGGTSLRSGDMHTFTSDRLSTVAKKMRDRLLQVEGDGNEGFRYISPVPDENEKADREKDLCSIALEGWELFHALFQGGEKPLELNRLKAFKQELTKQGSIVSVSRCRSEGITIPWAALYTLPLDTDKSDEMSLCGLFKEQLAANRWSDDERTLEEKRDLLDDPVACRNQAGCPLNTRKLARKTICPFGFWGFLHQIEQPLQQVTPTPSGQTPPEMIDPKAQTSFLARSPGEDLRLVCGVYSDLAGAQDHREEIRKLAVASLKVDDTEDRDRVLELLEEGGQHVYYFYCHGEMENSKFRLKLGFGDDPHYLAAADLDLTEIDWPDQPMPLVFINGCETMAVLPEQIHDFLSVLKQLGASGVIGTEVKVWTDLARPFGSRVLNHILNGKSVGETFLEIRKDMLRRYNPLGLLYNYYSPANLHLHDPGNCSWCATHKPAGVV